MESQSIQQYVLIHELDRINLSCYYCGTCL